MVLCWKHSGYEVQIYIYFLKHDKFVVLFFIIYGYFHFFKDEDMEDSEEQELIKVLQKGVKELREEYSMTQLDLAVKSGLDVRQIQRMEAGKTSPTLKTLIKVAKSFNMNVFEFFEKLSTK